MELHGKGGFALIGMGALAMLLGGCRSVERWPAAERPRPRQTVQLEYESTAAGRRPIDIGYLELGGGDDLYVFVHGLATNADSFARVLDGFAAHGKVLALDLPGCGQSDAPADFDYAVAHLADVVAQFVRAAPALAGMPGARPVLVANSLGAALVGYCLIHKWVEARALLVAGPAGFPMELPGFFHLLRGPFGGLFLWLAHWLPPEKLAGFAYSRPEVLTPDLGAMLAVQRRDPAHRHALLATFRSAVDMKLAAEMSPRIAEIRIPTLVVIGRQDKIIPPAHAELWRQALPHARVVVLDPCGHAAPEEQPQEFLRLAGELLGWPAH